MELRVLHYFLTIAREQSISGAAEFLHISQPTLSRQMKELEEELMYVANGTGRLEKVLLSKPSHVHQAEQINEISKKWDLQQVCQMHRHPALHVQHTAPECPFA